MAVFYSFFETYASAHDVYICLTVCAEAMVVFFFHLAVYGSVLDFKIRQKRAYGEGKILNQNS